MGTRKGSTEVRFAFHALCVCERIRRVNIKINQNGLSMSAEDVIDIGICSTESLSGNSQRFISGVPSEL